MKHGCIIFGSLFAFASIGHSAELYDVVVYGGVPGGVTAAVAAARHGARTVLIEQTGHVGGLSTSGVNTSEIEHMLEKSYGGLALEFYTRVGRTYGFDQPLYRWESHIAERIFNQMLKEAGVEVRVGRWVDSVQKRDGRITRITFTDGQSVAGKVFIDATYEGDLMARSGVSYTFGRESAERYREPLAGIRLQDQDINASPYDDAGNLLQGFVLLSDLKNGGEDRKVMNYNFRLTVSRGADRVAFPKPVHYDPARFVLLDRYLKNHPATKLEDLIDLYPFPSGKYVTDGKGGLKPVSTDKWEMNNKQNAVISIGHFGGQFEYPDADYAKRRRIFEEHRSYTQGFLYYLSHDPGVPEKLRQQTQQWGLASDEYADNGHWPYYMYVREARRMVGRYVMTQHDVQTDRVKQDAVALGSHWLDSHHVQRVAVSAAAFRNEGRIWVPVDKPYQISYRSLTPQDRQCRNLLVPVALSASHVAFCSLRVESTWMMTGHAAGAAAALAARSGAAVQEIDVAELQRQLREQKQAIDLP